MNVVRSFVNYAIIRELCDRMRFEVDCAKSHHRVISEGLTQGHPGTCHTVITVEREKKNKGGNGREAENLESTTAEEKTTA